MSFFRKSYWIFKGMREYTRFGYERASQRFVESDLDVCCSGKSYMITGGNSGIGKAVALEIAKRGGTVHIVCRSAERGAEALNDLKLLSKNNDIHLHILDLSLPKKVVEFAESFIDSGNALNVLINNAGCMVNTREFQEDGLERNFATNVLGTHLLSTILACHISKHDQPRLIMVSSGGMLVSKLDPNNLQFEKAGQFDGTFAYSHNKRMQVVLCEIYARKFPDIQVSCMHPGWADTPAVASSMPEFHAKMKNKLRSSEQGADTIVWLAVSESALSKPSGEFFQDREVTSKHLMLASTRSKPADEEQFMMNLDEMATKFYVKT